LAGEHGEAGARLARALELFSGLGARWQIGRTFFELGELDLAKADKAGARHQFSRALEAFETLKALPDEQRTQAALEALG
jgi:hypothetical protein